MVIVQDIVHLSLPASSNEGAHSLRSPELYNARDTPLAEDIIGSIYTGDGDK